MTSVVSETEDSEAVYMQGECSLSQLMNDSRSLRSRSRRDGRKSLCCSDDEEKTSANVSK